MEEGGALTLPEGLTYAPGKHLLDVFWDGVACYPGQQYEEISSADALESTAIRLLFAAPAGSEMRVLVRAYSIQPKLEGVEVRRASPSAWTRWRHASRTWPRTWPISTNPLMSKEKTHG